MSETVAVTKRTDCATAARSACAWRQVFASLFTPSWSLGLLLALCLFLPSYRGCNNQVVYVAEALVAEPSAPGEVYQSFLLTWPVLFGLVTFFGTLLLAATCDPQRASVLWWSYAALVFIHVALLSTVLLVEGSHGDSKAAWIWQEVSIAGAWLIPTLGLPAVLHVTFRYCRSWFSAAMWMQLALALTAAACTTFVNPSLVMAKDFLVGGALMIVASVGLIVSTVVQIFDGHRALTRKPSESPLKLSLQAMFVLMTIGGLACAWVGACLIVP